MSIPLEPLNNNLRPQHGSQQPRTDSFTYQGLQSRDTFRLLKLHAGQGERITCSIHHYVLGSARCPAYRAISYTWGEGAGRFLIHLPGDSVITVRENLRDALRSARDKESDCWLWIDAICINQCSNRERNHQVRLMADIYGNANVVLVWLQSAGKSADVARAFKFVHAAATYNDSEHSVYHYSRAHPRGNERNWHSVQSLCRLRYWTRKWIIQELVTARTVVLQIGNSKCSMTDLETFCRQLHRNRDNPAYMKLSNAGHQTWGFVVASQAARLALQRLEAGNEQQPRLIHELVERYASSECRMSCDHVYALYSLTGDHRRHLSIDYAASPVQRLVAVLRFVYTYERIEPSKVIKFANLLMRLFKLNREDVLKERRLAESLDLAVPATVLGDVQLQPESEESMALRGIVKPLQPMPVFDLDTSRDIWGLTAAEDHEDPQEGVGRPDMTYFGIAGSGFYGLAACRLQPGDTVWHFPETQLVFVVRASRDQRAHVLGRAYLFSKADDSDVLEPWLSRPLDYNDVRRGERQISMSLAALLELGSLAMPAKEAIHDLEISQKTSWLMNDVKALWKNSRRYRVVIAGSSKSIDIHDQTDLAA